jgi:hypothetical protein
VENGPKEKPKKVDKRHVKFNEDVEMHEISEIASSVNGAGATSRTWNDSKKQRENFIKG